MVTANGTGAHTSAPTLSDEQLERLPKATELVMSSGVMVWVRPATIFDQKMIVDMIEEKHPLPKEADYKIPVPEDDATIPGQLMTDTAAYHEALRQIGVTRNVEMTKGLIMACVDFPEGFEAMVARFLPTIQRKRAYLPLPSNDLEAVMFHAVVTTQDDLVILQQILKGALPVEMHEVISELRIFRPANQRGGHHSISDRGTDAPGASVGEEGQPESVGDESAV